MSLPLLSLIVCPGVLVSRPGQGHFVYFTLGKPRASKDKLHAPLRCQGREVDGRMGTVGDSRTDPSAVVDDGQEKVMRDLAGPIRVFMWPRRRMVQAAGLSMSILRVFRISGCQSN